MSNLSCILESFSALRILVIGEAMLDRYLHGAATRFCQETPVPVVTLSECKNQPGGAANTAINLASLGARVTLLSVIGDDEEGRLLQRSLQQSHSHYPIDCNSLFVSRHRSTLTKQRVMDGDRLLLRFDHGSTDAIDSLTERKVIDYFVRSIHEFDAIVISDYGYGLVTPRVIDALCSLRPGANPQPIVIDAKQPDRYKLLNPTAVKPNYQQVMQLLDRAHLQPQTDDRVEWVIAHRTSILQATGAKMVAVTLDQDGAVIVQPNHVHRLLAAPACPTRTIGAGDTFTATLAIALAAGASPILACELAATAAAVVIGKPGTALCTRAELESHLRSLLPSL